MKHRMRLRDWLAAATPLALLAFIFLAGPVGAWDRWADGVTASWAQAALSAMAVFAAIGVVWWQILHAKRERTRDEARKLENLGISLFFFRIVAYELSLYVHKGLDGHVQFESLRQQVEEFSSLPVYEAPTPAAVLNVATVRSAFLTLQILWDLTKESNTRNNDHYPVIGHFRSWAFKAEAAMRQECIDRGWTPAHITQEVTGGKLAAYGSDQLIDAAAA